MNYKYVILDFGKVLAGPESGDWNITSKFLELIDINKIDIEQLKKAKNNYAPLLSEKICTLEEEYDMFTRYYDGILNEIKYPNYNKKIAEEIAKDRTYCTRKYVLYDNVINELERLKEKYKLILLTDNWPSVIDYLNEYKMSDYFEKVYISSIYGCVKKDRVFFDYPINDFNIKEGEALFIDDAEENLEAAKEKGLDVLLMDRKKQVNDSKYKVINDLMHI